MKTVSLKRAEVALFLVLVIVAIVTGGYSPAFAEPSATELAAPTAATSKEVPPTPEEKIKSLEAEVEALNVQLQTERRAVAVLQKQRNQLAAELLDSQARLAIAQKE